MCIQQGIFSRERETNVLCLLVFYNAIYVLRIGNFVVFCITAATSILAYVWLVIVLVFISKDKVEVWEAVLTFLFFPILVCVAYAGDKGYLDALFCQVDIFLFKNIFSSFHKYFSSDSVTRGS